MRVHDLSPAYCYELLAAGKIEAVKIGGKRLIVTAPRDFLKSPAAPCPRSGSMPTMAGSGYPAPALDRGGERDARRGNDCHRPAIGHEIFANA